MKLQLFASAALALLAALPGAVSEEPHTTVAKPIKYFRDVVTKYYDEDSNDSSSPSEDYSSDLSEDDYDEDSEDLEYAEEGEARARGYASGACGGKPMRFCRCKRVGFCSRKKKCGRGLKRCRKNRKRCCKRSSEEDELIMARFLDTYEDEDIDLITDYLFNDYY